jgi:uncharacterized protein (TIGR03067 family)
MYASVVAFGVLAAGVSAPVPREPAKVPGGDWVEVSLQIPPDFGKVPVGATWTFKNGKVILHPKEGTKRPIATFFTFQADPKKRPKEIDLSNGHDGRKWVQHGIYKIEGDRLTLCLGVAAGDAPVNESKRPTKFKAGPDVSLVVLERVKK